MSTSSCSQIIPSAKASLKLSSKCFKNSQNLLPNKNSNSFSLSTPTKTNSSQKWSLTSKDSSTSNLCPKNNSNGLLSTPDPEKDWNPTLIQGISRMWLLRTSSETHSQILNCKKIRNISFQLLASHTNKNTTNWAMMIRMKPNRPHCHLEYWKFSDQANTKAVNMMQMPQRLSKLWWMTPFTCRSDLAFGQKWWNSRKESIDLSFPGWKSKVGRAYFVFMRSKSRYVD